MSDDMLTPCKHGNVPVVRGEPSEYKFRAECAECRCGHRAKYSTAPIYARIAWNRTHTFGGKKEAGKI